MNGRTREQLGHDSDAIAGFLPLVDVLLAVLCTAMLLAGRARRVREVPVELPAAAGVTAATPHRTVRLAFDRGGGLWVDGVSVDLEGLQSTLRAATRDGRRVVLAGDARADYATVARVLQVVQRAGVKTAGLQVVPRTDPSAGR